MPERSEESGPTGQSGQTTEMLVADASLVGAVEQAKSALLENEPAVSVGGHLGHTVETDGVVTHFFESWQSGYAGWRWAVSLARVDGDAQVTVVESQLVPGDGALLAPDWVPWSERLSEYQAQQAAEKAAAESEAVEAGQADGDDLDDDLDDDIDEDDLDDDIDEALDGIDIDDSDDDE